MRPPQSWRSARLTVGIAAATALAWLVVAAAGLSDEAAIWGGFIPYRLGMAEGRWMAPFALTPLTATLLHGGFAHVALNLVIHLFCGRSIEAVLGKAGLLTLYVLGAYGAAAVHFALDPVSAHPMIGASGAISALIGAYAMLFGRNKVRVADPRLAAMIHGAWLFAAWFVIQLAATFALRTLGVHVSFGAHVGGFFIGVLLARPLLLFRYRKA